MKPITIRHDSKTYPVRELIMPDGTIWLVSIEAVEQIAPEEVDDMIGFYVPEEDFLQANDSALRAIIE